MKRVLMAAAGAFVLAMAAQPALAADIPLAPAYKAPVVAPMFNWTGFYVGGVAGGGLMTSSTGDPEHEIWDNDVHLRDWGGTAGLTAGYNAQFGAGVLGLEGDLNWSSFKNSFQNGSSSDEYVSTKWNWFATVRLRGGVAVDRAMIYATGGLAFVDVNYFTISDPTSACGTSSCARASKVQTGFVVGAGAEYAVAPNMTFKLEYLYIGLPDQRSRRVDDPDYTIVFNSSAHIGRFGLNWHF
jgi:outer membrane immunogenic protein